MLAPSPSATINGLVPEVLDISDTTSPFNNCVPPRKSTPATPMSSSICSPMQHTPPPNAYVPTDVIAARSGAEHCAIAVGIAKLAGRKDEDTVSCVPSFTGVPGDDFYGVFDGHRGIAIAEHASDTLHQHLRVALATKAPAAALGEAFARCHQSARQARLRSGACALCFATVRGEAWCANAGDCRAVLSRRAGHAERLSTDHKPSDPAEEARIVAGGGLVELGCLDGDLAVSRGLGDFDYEAKGFSHVPAVVGPIPGPLLREHVREPTLAARCGFVLLASDGVWDVFTDAEACEMVRDALGRGASPDAACDEILSVSKARGSEDDKAAMLLLLNPVEEAGTGAGGGQGGAAGMQEGAAGEPCAAAGASGRVMPRGPPPRGPRKRAVADVDMEDGDADAGTQGCSQGTIRLKW